MKVMLQTACTLFCTSQKLALQALSSTCTTPWACRQRADSLHTQLTCAGGLSSEEAMWCINEQWLLRRGPSDAYMLQ